MNKKLLLNIILYTVVIFPLLYFFIIYPLAFYYVDPYINSGLLIVATYFLLALWLIFSNESNKNKVFIFCVLLIMYFVEGRYLRIFGNEAYIYSFIYFCSIFLTVFQFKISSKRLIFLFRVISIYFYMFSFMYILIETMGYDNVNYLHNYFYISIFSIEVLFLAFVFLVKIRGI